MTIESIAMQALSGAEPVQSGAAPVSTQDFSAWFERELATTNARILQSEQATERLITGEAENLHQVMIALEKAKLSFDLMVQIRNKALESYQEILRMQI